MIAIAVDDNEINLEVLTLQLQSIPKISEVHSFRSPESAIEWMKTNRADAAFLDIIMEGLNGISLAEEIEVLQPDCRIVFCSGSEDYAMDAFRVHASGYLTKPIMKAQLEAEIARLFPASPAPAASGKKLRVQCFGNFAAFGPDGTPLSFRYKRTRELLAYLIHRRGATCSTGELASVLFEDRDNDEGLQSQIRNLLADLTRVLKGIGAEDVLYKDRGLAAIIPDKISCDYYTFCDGMEKSMRSFHGEYMAQYSWGEETAAWLSRQVLK